MYERRESEILLDDLFSKSFFTLEELPQIKITFPLPASPDKLESFFSSPDGMLFKKAASKLLKQLVQWAHNNGLDAEKACALFKKDFLKYSGSDAEMNSLLFPLYHDGIPQLAGLIDLLSNQVISLDYQIWVINNLINEMIVCAPGNYTHISNAYYQFLGKLDLGLEWMMVRRSISQQVVLRLFKSTLVQLNKETPSQIRKEIHYVNAILNGYAESLKINTIKDDYINLCDVEIVCILLNRFISEIPKSLTLETVIENIIFRLPLEYANDGRLLLALDIYGIDSLFNLNNLYELGDEGKISLRWDYHYLICASLFHRLYQSGFINKSIPLSSYDLDEQATLYYYPDRSLKCALVRQDGQHFSLISYLFMQDDLSLILKHLDFFLSEACSNKQRLEVIMGITHFLKWRHNCNEDRHSSKSMEDKEVSIVVDLIIKLNPLHHFFDKIVIALPQEPGNEYLKRIGWVVLCKKIRTQEHLVNVLSSLSKEQAGQMLMHLNRHALTSLIQSGKGLARILQALPESQWNYLFNLYEPLKQNLNVTSEDLLLLLEVVYVRTNPKRWNDYSMILFEKPWDETINKLAQVLNLLIKLPQEKIPYFLGSLTQRFDSISYSLSFSLDIRHYDKVSLTHFFKKAPKDKVNVFLEFFPKTVLSYFFKTPEDVYPILAGYSADTIELLLNALGQDHWNEVFKSGFSVTRAVIVGGVDKTILLLNHLNLEKTVSIHSLNSCVISKPSQAVSLLAWFDTNRLRSLVKSDRDVVALFELPPNSTRMIITILGENYIRQLMNLEAYVKIYQKYPIVRNTLFELFKEETILFACQTYLAYEAEQLTQLYKIDSISWDTFIQREFYDVLNSETKKILKHYFREKHTLFLYIQEWIELWKNLKNRSFDHCKVLLNTYEPQKLGQKIVVGERLFLEHLPQRKCLVLFSLVPKEHYKLLFEQWKHRMDKNMNLNDLNKIPFKMARLFLKCWSIPHLSKPIQNEMNFWHVFNLLEREEQIEWIRSFKEDKLHTLLLKNRALPELILIIQKYARPTQVILYFAALRAMKSQCQIEASSLLTHLFFWKPPQYKYEKAAFDLLETALEKELASVEIPGSGFHFLNHLTEDQQIKEIVNHCYEGRLAPLTKAFCSLFSQMNSSHLIETNTV